MKNNPCNKNVLPEEMHPWILQIKNAGVIYRDGKMLHL